MPIRLKELEEGRSIRVGRQTHGKQFSQVFRLLRYPPWIERTQDNVKVCDAHALRIPTCVEVVGHFFVSDEATVHVDHDTSRLPQGFECAPKSGQQPLTVG